MQAFDVSKLWMAMGEQQSIKRVTFETQKQ
jgi:hypothetical protein